MPIASHTDRSTTAAWSSGLEDVVVAATRLSSVDGERGELVIADRDLDDVAADGYVAAAALLARASSDDGGTTDNDDAAFAVALR